MKIDKKRLKEILKAENLSGYEVWNFKLNKYRDNRDQILRAAYIYLRKVCGYNATDFYLLKNKFLKYENWSLCNLSKNDCSEFRTLILDIVN